jgi:hypothetical protein
LSVKEYFVVYEISVNYILLINCQYRPQIFNLRLQDNFNCPNVENKIK